MKSRWPRFLLIFLFWLCGFPLALAFVWVMMRDVGIPMRPEVAALPFEQIAVIAACGMLLVWFVGRVLIDLYPEWFYEFHNFGE